LLPRVERSRAATSLAKAAPSSEVGQHLTAAFKSIDPDKIVDRVPAVSS
jgi:hypothetical protein